MADIAIDVDLQGVAARAARAGDLLRSLRAQYDLAPFEFTRKVRIAPLETPHSHPVLTLNTFALDDPDRFLGTYLHEQMHWYLAECRADAVEAAIGELRARYPDVPSAKAERARDAYSVYLHLVVNWLEIEAVSAVLGRDRALAVAQHAPVYPWGYATVIRDWRVLGALYADHGIAPMPDARTLAGG